MGKNILVISTSLRKNSNSEALADSFCKGAEQGGNVVEKISLKEKSIGFCKGCFACLEKGSCIIADDAVEIVKKMHDADVIVFATPIYYYEMSGQMKTLLDRANALYGSDYAFQSIYLLSAAAEDQADVDKRAIQGLEGWICCFERAKLSGTVFAGGVNEPNEIQGHIALKKAYDMGSKIS